MANKIKKPPFLTKWVLKKINRRKTGENILGDFEEFYNEIYNDSGWLKADFWYRKQMFKSIPDFLSSTLRRSTGMLKNYVKIAFRNIIRHKGFSFINIFGLAAGMACCILISLWVLDELNYNNFHDNGDNIYGVVISTGMDGKRSSHSSSPVPMALGLKEGLPDIVDAVRYKPADRILLKNQGISFYESGSYYVDASFLKFFSFNLKNGDKNTCLDDPLSIVITERIAEKYFGEEDPIGKIFTFNGEYELNVSGVLENPPHNSSLQFSILMSYGLREILDKKVGYNPSWLHNDPRTYIQLQENSNQEISDEKINSFAKMSFRKEVQEYIAGMKAGRAKDGLTKQLEDGIPIEFSIIPLSEMRFSSHYGGGGRARYLSIFSTVAFIILLIACINFMNLSTARSAKRSKEIGLRKVAGACRKNVIIQFLGESLLLSFASLVIAVLLTIVLIPVFNEFFGKAIPVSMLGNGFVLPVLLLIALFAGLAGGTYPALVLSSFQPVKTLKGNTKSGAKNTTMRKFLVVLQFILSISLIIGTAVIYKQLDFIRNWNLGYEKDHVIYIPLNSGSRQYYDVLKNNLESDSRVVSVTGLHQEPSFVSSSSSYADWDGKDPDNQIVISNFRVNYDYIKTLKINLISGRDFSRKYASDKQNSFVVSETMTDYMGLDSEEAIGKRLMFTGQEGKIIGVVKNFHHQPLDRMIRPVVMRLLPRRTEFLIAKISSADISSTISFIEKTWKEVIPSFPFEYRFLDADFEEMYAEEERTGNVLKSFALIAIMIACMGIYGLASFTAEQRTKEIGVRKVLGASVSSIVNLLSKEFLILVAVSNLISWPLSYYLMNNWLQSYPYRTSIGVWTLLMPTLLALILTLLTVGYQVIKAARSNPITSLRYE